MADIVALSQHDQGESWEFINVDTAMRWWIYCPDSRDNNAWNAWCIARVTRLPLGPYSEDAEEDEGTIPVLFDEDAFALLNDFRARCNLHLLDSPERDEA